VAGAKSESLETKRPVRIGQMLRRSEAARGYLLLSPAMAVLLFVLAAPIALLVLYSFCTENGLVLDTNPTLSQYAAIVNREGYRTLPGNPVKC
jgi:spermidine/putrescine transport system permease protein